MVVAIFRGRAKSLGFLFCIGGFTAFGSEVLLDPGYPAGAVTGAVWTLSPTADGGMLVGGEVSAIGTTPASGLAKLDATGAGEPNWGVTAVGIDAAYGNRIQVLAPGVAGPTWVGGVFDTLGGELRTGIARLDATGAHDAAFPTTPLFHDGLYGITAIVPLSDGGAYVAGFSSVYVSDGVGAPPHKVARLAADGTVDPTFSPPEFSSGNIHALVPTEGGKLYVLGDLTYSLGGGTEGSKLLRLEPDGSIDRGFVSPFVGYSSYVLYAGAEDAEGRLLIGGNFRSINGESRGYVARLRRDGTLDPSFVPDLAPLSISSAVRVIAPLDDGSVLVGGHFATNESNPRRSLMRLLADGRSDPTFVLTPNQSASADGHYPTVRALLPGDSKMLVGGDFTVFASQSRAGLVRLTGLSGLTWDAPTFATEPAALTVQPGDPVEFSVTVTGTPTPVVRWYREGSTDVLAEGTSLHLSGVTVSEAGGYWAEASSVLGTVASTTAWLTVSAPLAAPTLTTAKPAVGFVGESYLFQFVATGSPAPVFSLETDALPNGLILEEDGRLHGTPTEPFHGTLTIVARNSEGEARADFALVVEARAAPVFLTSPQSVSCLELESFTLGVAVDGWPYPSLQWYRDGVAIDGATGTRLSRSRAEVGDSGSYEVRAANAEGTVSSASAQVTVAVNEKRPGRTVLGYNPAASGFGLSSGAIRTLATRPDGSLVAGGNFQGIVGKNPVRYLLGLTADGAIDPGFNAGTGPDGAVFDGYSDAQGRVLLAGEFRTFDGTARPGLVRLLPDGSVDPSFAPHLDASWMENLFSPPTGLFMGPIAAAPDGGVFACVSIEVAGLWRCGVVRFHADGTVRTAIDPDHVLTALPTDLAVMPDGGLITSAGQRLTPALKLDADYNANFRAIVETTVGGYWSADFQGRAVVVDPDGRAYLGGIAGNDGYANRLTLMRLETDGTLDGSFSEAFAASVLSPGDEYFAVSALRPLPGGRLFVAGAGGIRDGVFVVVDAEGRPDPAFLAGAVDYDLLGTGTGDLSTVYATALQSDGKLVLGGQFRGLGSLLRPGLGAIHGWSYLSRYADWATLTLPEGERAPEFRPAGDAPLPNYARYAFALDRGGHLPRLTTPGADGLHLSFTRRRDLALDPSIGLVLESSDNLLDWTELPLDEADPLLFFEADSVTLPLPTEGAERFYRVRVELHP